MSDLLESAIGHLDRLISFATESHRSNLKLIDYIADLAKRDKIQLKLSHNADAKKANLLLTLPAHDGSMDGGVLLSGHTDVVPVAGQNWSSDPFRMVKKEGKLFGRGSCDMKGFIACCLAMLPNFVATKLKEPLHFAFSYDEEVGCLGAKVLVEHMRSQDLIPRIAIIGEPTDMQVIESHKGVYEYSTEFTGLAGHSSLPDRAVSAIEYAVLYAHKLLSLREYLKGSAPLNSPFDPAHTTIHLGALRGGIACNVVADSCALSWEVRPVQSTDAGYVHQQMDDYALQLLKAMRSVYPDSDISKRIISEVEGLMPMNETQARDLFCQLTGNSQVGAVSYGTEAGLFQSLGTSCIVCGPGSIQQAHKADEFVYIEQIEQCLLMLKKLNAKISL